MGLAEDPSSQQTKAMLDLAIFKCSMFCQIFSNEERRSARRGQGRLRRERAASHAPCSVSLVCSQTNKQRLGVKPDVSAQGKYSCVFQGNRAVRLSRETITPAHWECSVGGACMVVRAKCQWQGGLCTGARPGSAHCFVYECSRFGTCVMPG